MSAVNTKGAVIISVSAAYIRYEICNSFTVNLQIHAPLEYKTLQRVLKLILVLLILFLLCLPTESAKERILYLSLQTYPTYSESRFSPPSLPEGGFSVDLRSADKKLKAVTPIK